MRDIRLIGLDLDETLLRRDKSISERTYRAIGQAQAAGITVVPVTGRPLSGLMPEVRRIDGLHYAITSNGAVTTILPTGERIRERLMPKASVRAILASCSRPDLSREVFISGYGYCTADILAGHERRYAGTPFLDYVLASRRVVDDLDSFIALQPDSFENICIVYDDISVIDELHSSVRAAYGSGDEALCISRTAPRVIEIGANGADKGAALLALAATLGIPRKCVCAVGDSDNDLGMLRSAGYPVAMGNASDAVKALASHITSDNEHDGVAEVIESFIHS